MEEARNGLYMAGLTFAAGGGWILWGALAHASASKDISGTATGLAAFGSLVMVGFGALLCLIGFFFHLRIRRVKQR